MSEDEISKVNILMFKGKECAACNIVEPIIRKIISTSRGSAQLTFIDTDEEKELTERYEVRTIPVIYYNDKCVLTAEQASELISGEFGFMMAGSPTGLDNFQESSNDFSASGAFELQGSPSNQGNNIPGFDQNSIGSQSGLFNHLFNELITSSVESNAESIERRQKFNMLAISQKTMTPEAIQNLTRPSLGDYVHIGVLQSIVTSILAINPQSGEYIYRVGRNMGRYGNVQFRFLRHYPRIFEWPDLESKFRDLLEGLQELYSANSLGLPLYLASRSLVEPISNTKARLTVYDSAFSAQMAPIGQPVCYIISGEIAGLIETTLGEKNVSVIEKRCFGLGDPFCQFEIELGKEMDFSYIPERPFLTKSEKEKFQNSLDTISKNMYRSSLIRTILRPGVSDHVHISVLQQVLNGLKFSDPFFSTLLFYAGLHYGRTGADYAVLERVMKASDVESTPEFEKGVKLLVDYFNDPATILTRWQGIAEYEIVDEETAIIKIQESAISSGLNMVDSDFVIESDDELVTLCDFTSGFIQGRLSRILDEDVKVEEITCYATGTDYCSYRIEID